MLKTIESLENDDPIWEKVEIWRSKINHKSNANGRAWEVCYRNELVSVSELIAIDISLNKSQMRLRVRWKFLWVLRLIA